MKKFWKFILTIIIAVAAYGYEAYDFGSEAHEAISLLQGQLEVKLLDVGHGDAILLRNQAVAILVDTGDYKNSDILVRRLKTLGVRKLDALIITHHHLDHLGGVIKILNNKTLLDINLITGRHHQIRVQFSHLKHPLVGDVLYGGSHYSQLMLYAYEISFKHPITNDRLTFSKIPTSRLWDQFLK